MIALLIALAATPEKAPVAGRTGSSTAVLVDRIAAVVENRCITRSAIASRAARDRVTAQQALDLFIEEELIARDAAASNLAVTEQEVDRAMDDIAARNNLDRPKLEAALKEQGLTVEGYRESIGRQLLELRWLLLKQAGSVMPAGEKAMAEMKKHLVDDLKKNAAIEVRP